MLKIKFPAERLSGLLKTIFGQWEIQAHAAHVQKYFMIMVRIFRENHEGVDTGERFVEIYNLVFMQYNRDHNKKLSNLPKQCVDTGMGLKESLQFYKTSDNYKTDIFNNIIESIAETLNEKIFLNPSLRVIADHLRSSVFLISDGVNPSNEGRGYVLRRIIRRALLMLTK